MKNLLHDSAQKHVTGEAVYVSDIDFGNRLLYGHVVYSKHAHARILSVNTEAARKVSGVKAVLTYKDIPGANQMGPVVHDEPCLAETVVQCIGQAVVLIAAESTEICLEAAKFIEIEYEPLEAILDIETSMAKENRIAPPRKIERGDIAKGFSESKHIFSGTLTTGAQEHWYLETQAALCVCGEGKEIMVHASSQNPSETQTIVAEVLGWNKHQVTVEVKRMGGGFGGKETQGNHVAAWAALLARETKHPVLVRLFRDDDQIMTGKRHRFFSEYTIGFDDEGLILAYDIILNSDAGYATDLSMAILERALFHAENAYFIPNIRIIGNAWRTNLPSNTAYRGFGGPQGMAAIENAIDRIARFLKKDPLEIRLKNFYGINDRNIAPYKQRIEHNRLYTLYDQLVAESDYKNRRSEINLFNASHKNKKRGIALTPVKFGISFTTCFLNQAGALVHIYADGTIQVNHGGTEMGQGLNTKILEVASAELGVSASQFIVTATNTSKVPNTSATAASSGSDLNGMAVKNAIDTLKERLLPLAKQLLNDQIGSEIKEEPVLKNDTIYYPSHPGNSLPFNTLIRMAYLNQISLSATGFYKTPDIYYDKEKGEGKPFHYFAYGMSVSEVEIDTYTGAVKLLRTDILHDVGESLNPEIDKGQIVGGFIQGVGWCTTEEIKWDVSGNLLNHSPDTYKIPGIQDIPVIFNVKLLQNVPNFSTIRRSKAVGEPPFMLAFSVWLAIKDAISAVGNHETEPEYSLPATNERIVLSIEKIKNR